MSEPSIFFSEVNERQGVFHRRVFLLGGMAGVGLLALSGRLLALQVFETGRYSKLSENNQFNFPLIPPPRGRILDRNGAVIATNRLNIRLMASRGKDTDLKVVEADIKALLPIDDARLAKTMRDLENGPERSPVMVMEDLEWEQFAAIQVRSAQLPELTAELSEIRVYPHAGAFAHVIGYVNLPDPDDIKAEVAKGGEVDPIIRHPGFRIGRTGIERAFDADLRGLSGYRKLEVDARSRVIRADPAGDKAPIPGKDIQLTLDVDIQNRALEVFGEESGAAVMLDCRTGDILCLVSAPSFDANRFVKGMPGPEYNRLANYERKPLLNKALSGAFPPGSTFKPATALALLEAGVNPEERVHCSGSYYFGRTFRCWGTHGSQNMHDAIKNSCDVYFYHMCNRAGIDTIARTARALGYQQQYDIGLPQTTRSLVPDRAWKAKTFPRERTWGLGETLSVAIGQGALAVTPLQMAVAVARIANGRKALRPRLIKSIGGVEQPSGAAVDDLPFSAEHMDIVRAGMASVANDAGGTAYRQSQLGLGDVKMAGKTGTAQVRSYDRVQSRSSASVTWRLKDHNLFTAFAPYDDPRYALAVLVEHGGLGGATAGAPRAREIMRVALLKDRELHDRIVQTPIPDIDPNAPLEGMAPPDPTLGPAPSPQAPPL